MIKNFIRILFIIIIPLFFALHGRELWQSVEPLLNSLIATHKESLSEDNSEEDISPIESPTIPSAVLAPPKDSSGVELPQAISLPEDVDPELALGELIISEESMKEYGDDPLVPDLLPHIIDGNIADLPLLTDDSSEGSEDTEDDEGREDHPYTVLSTKIKKGDTFSKIIDPLVSAVEGQRFIDATKGIFSFSRLRAGQPYTLQYDASNERLIRFEYEIDKNEKLIVENDDTSDKANAYIEKIAYDKKLALIENVIVNNLFLAMDEVGETPQLALVVANLFAWDINFIRDIKFGDSFSILVEKLYRNGEFKGYGKTLGATFINSGKKYEAYLFEDPNGRSAYYDFEGKNLKKVLLQSPLSFTRVTSGYTHSRKHPIFGDYRAHLGIDYGAPYGTPIMAVGDGVITRIGWVGGYGKHIVINHGSGLESLYSHMSKYSKGLKKGSKVRQGQVIAYVGSTGYSTGPHLDFRIRQNGKFINPTKAINPRAEELNKKIMDDFRAQVALIRSFMMGERELSSYKADEKKVSEGG